MRYKELYEMIDMAMIKSPPSFPISDNLKQFFIDQAVDKIGETVVLKKRVLDLGTVSAKRAVLPVADMTTKVYKVEAGDKNLPYISEENTNPNALEGDISNNAWYVKQGDRTGPIASGSGTNVDPSVFTMVASTESGADSISGALVTFDGIGGVSKTGLKHPLNGVTYKTTTFDDTSIIFTADTDISTVAGYSAQTASKGVFKDVGYYINFLKVPEGAIKVYYYAKPKRFISLERSVDLPEELISAVAHLVTARILSTDNQLQLGSGHRGLAKQITDDWVQLRSRREQFPDIVPAPMTEFVNK